MKSMTLRSGQIIHVFLEQVKAAVCSLVWFPGNYQGKNVLCNVIGSLLSGHLNSPAHPSQNSLQQAASPFSMPLIFQRQTATIRMRSPRMRSRIPSHRKGVWCS